MGTPRRDCKPQAKEAIKRFKTLRGVLESPLEELQQIDGVGPHSTFGIKLVQEVAREFLKEKIIDTPVYKSAQEIFDYLYHSMRDLKKEVFKLIYLNNRSQIIEIVDLFENMKGPGAHRQYVLERINGELVFRQTEIDAAMDAAIDAAFADSGRTAARRHIIKLP